MKKVFNFRLAILFSLSIALGIFCAYLFLFDKMVAGLLSLATFIGVEVCFLVFTKINLNYRIVFLCLGAVFFMLGLLGFLNVVNSYEKANLNNHKFSVSAKIVENAPTDYGNRLILSDVEIVGNVSCDPGYKIALYVYGQNQLDIGDIISFEAYLNDRPIEYEKRLSASYIERNIKYTANINAEEIIVIGKSLNLFERVNIFIRDSLNKGLERDQFNVAYALLTGFSEYIDEDVITSYREAGVAHIFAVSGLHIGFLAIALEFLFRKLRLNKVYKAVGITLILLFYSGVCGFSASSLRATIMCSSALFCKAFGKRYDGLSALGLAFTLILCFSPVQLFCVGFQLSFMVVLGIILLSPLISKTLSFLPKKVASSIATVVSAQVVGIPISLTAFGEFSTIAIIANILFIPIVGAIFIALIVLTVIGGLFSCEGVTLFLLNFILKLINMLISAFDYKVFMVGGFSFIFFVIFYYSAVFLPSGLFNFSRLMKTVCFIVCTCVCVTGTVVYNLSNSSKAHVYVIGSETICATVLSSNGENTLIISSVNAVFSTSRLKRLSDRTGIDKFDQVVLTAGCVADLQNVTTKLHGDFSLSKLCYFGQKNEALETAIFKSFGIRAVSYGNKDRLPINEFYCSYSLDGNAVNVSKDNVDLAIFSRFGKYNSNYLGLGAQPDCIIAFDYCENIYVRYGKVRTISYLDNTLFESAQSGGTLTLKFNQLLEYNA